MKKNWTILLVFSAIVILGGILLERANLIPLTSRGEIPPEEMEGISYYTCPMHPSVRSDRPGSCPVCGMSLVKKTEPSHSGQVHQDPAGGMGDAISLSPAQRVMANVSVVKAERRSVANDIRAAGIVSYAEPGYRHISARFPGRLEKLHLSYTGQFVGRGDPVADIYSPEAVSAQHEFLLALTAYESASNDGDRENQIESDVTYAASTRQLLEQSEQKLLQWGFTVEQIALLRSERRPRYVVTIHSPVTGTVVKKSVDPQHYVVPGDDMFDVADLSHVWIYLDVYEQEIRFVRPGQRVIIFTEAYPGEEFTGRVVFVDPVLDPETRTVRVRTEFLNTDGRLKPNMFVNGTIKVPTSDALVIPSSAVLSTGKRKTVWVETDENSFEARDIVVGGTAGDYTVVLDGLEEGEGIAATGGFLIDSESTLREPDGSDPHAGHAGREGG